ncbi:Putative ribonuclease H protein At1g65750 [Linum perenne]
MGPRSPTFFFADDLVLFGEASLSQCRSISNCLDRFCLASGQLVSLDKSRVFFSKNTQCANRRNICRSLGIAETTDLGRYLGVPVIHGRVRKDTFSYIIERIDKKLDGWKRNTLSLAGRVTLAQSVLNSLPSYAMQTAALPASILNAIDCRIRRFVWGGSNDQRKIHLVSWDVICRPKSQGGLGLRKASELNGAFNMKLGWQLLKYPDKLWVRVLTSKYLKEVGGNIEIRRKNWGSNIWRSIRRIRPTLKNCCQASIRNGADTSFWHSVWLDSGIKLADVATRAVDEEESQRSVAGATDGEGHWDWTFLNGALPPHFVGQVAGMQPPSPTGGDDELIWGPDPKGLFSIKSAYEILAAIDRSVVDQRWKAVWNWQGLNRVRLFLWLAVHNRLLTNSERRRRHLCTDDICTRCRAGTEDVLHVLRDCPLAKSTWLSLIPAYDHQSFFTGTLLEWFTRELNSSNRGQLVGITAWLIWKARNESIFDNASVTSDQLRLRVLSWIAGVQETMRAQSLSLSEVEARQRETLISWIPPPDDSITINTDGSVLHLDGKAAAGGVLRNSLGCMIGAFSANLGTCSIMRVELRAAEIGLHYAWSLGINKVILQLDSLAAVNAIMGAPADDMRHSHTLGEISRLRQRDWQISVQHVFREANRVADLLAHLGHGKPLGTTFF